MFNRIKAVFHAFHLVTAVFHGVVSAETTNANSPGASKKQAVIDFIKPIVMQLLSYAGVVDPALLFNLVSQLIDVIVGIINILKGFAHKNDGNPTPTSEPQLPIETLQP